MSHSEPMWPTRECARLLESEYELVISNQPRFSRGTLFRGQGHALFDYHASHHEASSRGGQTMTLAVTIYEAARSSR